ncbi:receptor-like protein EIX2 [Phoenix dactylifera]|uniref:Receptor-like protein EIX2 n=1 Tax=Phoenix dactylifera TaxID=42345 RepID=A0A8B9A103_PHODC|nr:receptor-like protein EIX2 [Phoenix dactylifera]
MTGHVVKLDLHYPYPYDGRRPDKSEVSPSLHLGHLNYLDLSMNNFSGAPIPDFIGSLAKLEYLILSNAGFGGTIPHQLGNLSNLLYLDLASNLHYSSDVDNLGWLPSIRFLQHLDMSNVNLSKASNWIHVINMLPSLSVLRLFRATLPSLPSTLPHVNLQQNNLSGPLPNQIGALQSLGYLDLGLNLLDGSIPASLGKLSALYYLNLAANSLAGALTEAHFANLTSLSSLDLSYNLLTVNCKLLTTIDLGNNKLSGRIPEWIGGSLLSLRVLRPRSNMLDGNIPWQLSLLSSLQVLDLADNKLSGTLPLSFGNFIAMIMIQNGGKLALFENMASYYIENIQINTKGSELMFTSVFSLVTSLDLSDNNIFGEIPEELTNFHGLHSLNLSGNHLTERIPINIGAMGQLEPLDLSMNNLSSIIPTSIAYLNFLEHLNLPYNNLSRRIPSGNQLQILNDPSIYISNQYLCGLPLPEKYPGDEPAECPIEKKTG